MADYITIDIGGTSIKYGCISEDLKITVRSEAVSQKKGGKDILDTVFQIIERLSAGHDIRGVCISTAGIVDSKEGSVVYSENIPGYSGICIKSFIEEKFGIPCEVENDVNCAALAEHFEGAGKGCASSVMMTVGTGIGGAFIIKNRLWTGNSGSAMEVGYLRVSDGIFQEEGSASALVRNTRKRMHDPELNGRRIFDLAKDGNKICREEVHHMAEILGEGIAQIAWILNPEAIILGGGVMAQEEVLRTPILESMKSCMTPWLYQKTSLRFARLKNDAGMVGAYLNFRQAHERGD